MNKFGVVAPATEDMKCPICGAQLIQDAAVFRCPEHGTQPLEAISERRMENIRTDKVPGHRQDRG